MQFLKLFCLFFTSLSFSASAITWQINKDHSELFFQVPYLTVSEVTGRFNKFSGKADFPEGKRIPSHILISVETDSLDTGNRQRDGHLKSQEFLKTKTHPQMIFESRSISELKPGQLRAQGTLSLGGVTKPFALNFELTDPRKDTWNYESRFARFRSKINREEFRIVWNKTLTDNKYLVGEEISFWGTFQLQPVNSSTPSSKHMIPDTKYIRKREKLNRGEISQVDVSKPGSTASVEKTNPHVRLAPEVNAKEISDIRGRTSWQVAFWTLGMFGFMACIIIGLYTKKIVSEHWPEKYAEGGLFGLLTDSVTIPLFLIYALTFWEVGWG